MSSSLLRLDHVFISSSEENNCWVKLYKFTKWLFSGTQNDNFVHQGQFWVLFYLICSALRYIYSLLAWDKSHDSKAKLSKLAQMLTTIMFHMNVGLKLLYFPIIWPLVHAKNCASQIAFLVLEFRISIIWTTPTPWLTLLLVIGKSRLTKNRGKQVK